MYHQTNARRYQDSRLTAEADRILKAGRVCGQQTSQGGKTFTVTTGWIRDNATPAGGYKSDQLRLIGLRYPLQEGWAKRADGLSISEKSRIEFESYHTGFGATKKSRAVLAGGVKIDKDGGTFGSTTSAAVSHCGCTHVLPWEDCEHTAAAGDHEAAIASGDQIGLW